jgi:predicted ATP-dependent endonuclease of OLD family
MTPQERQRINDYNHQYRQRRLAEQGATLRAHENELGRARRARRKETNPEAVRENERRWSEAYKQRCLAKDPEAYLERIRKKQAGTRARRKLKFPEKARTSARATFYKKHGLKPTTANAIVRLVKRGAPAEIADDVAVAMVLEILEGRVRQKDVAKAIPELVRRHYRQFDRYKNLSLDAARASTGKAWIDDLASDTEHF